MPTYDQLDNEAAWRDEYEPPALARFNERTRVRYQMTKSQCGSKGDNRHLKGRHRSRRWCLTSVYCTNRTYATTDARDKAGPADALRATDVGLTGTRLREATARLLAAKRAGRLPQLAEFFGTVDGVRVVGWYEGHESTSDDSHLYHLHLGYWTVATDDENFFTELFDVITGDDIMADPQLTTTNWRVYGAMQMWDTVDNHVNNTKEPLPLVTAIKGIQASLSASAARESAALAAINALATTGGVDAAPILAAVERVGSELGARIAELEADGEQLRAQIAAYRAAEAAAAQREAELLASVPVG